MASELERPKPKAKPASPAKYESFVKEQLARARGRIRLLDGSTAILAFLAGTLAYGLVVAVCDRWLELPAGVRQVAFVGYVGCSVAFLTLALVRPLLNPINPYYAARRLEESLPEAKNSVVNWLDLHDETLPTAIKLALSHRAAKDVARADLEQAISGRRTTWAGAVLSACVIALVVLFVLGPRQFPSLLYRAFAPFLDSSLATRTRISIVSPEGGDAVVAVGRPVPIQVWVEGRIPDSARSNSLRLLYRYHANEPYESRLMERGDGSREWQAVVAAPEVRNGFWYRVAGGDAQTDEHRVQVRSTPLVTGVEVTYRYPKYLRWQDETNRDPNIQAVRGTEVSLLVRTNREVREGLMAPDRDPAIPGSLVAGDSSALLFQWKLDKEGSYRIRFSSRDGEKNVDPMPYTIRVMDDRPPQVALTAPGDVPLPANGILRAEGTATDDFGLTGMSLQFQVEDEKLRLQPKPYRANKSFELTDGRYPFTVEYKDFVELEQLKRATGQPLALEPGMRIKYWLEATDNCDHPEPNVGQSQVFTLTIAPPEQNKAKQEQQKQQAKKDQQKHEAEQDKKQQDQKQQGQPADAPKPDQQQGDKEKPDPGEKKQDGQKGDQPGDQQGADKDLQKKFDDLQRAVADKEKQPDDDKSQADKQQPKASDAQKDGDKQQQQPKAGDAQKDGDKQQQQPKAGDAQKDGDKQQQQPKAGDAQKDGDKQQQQPKAGDAQKDGDKQQQRPKAGDAQKDGDKQQQQPKAGDAQKDGDKQQQRPKAGDTQKDGDKQQQQPKAGDAQKDGDKQQQQPKAGDAQKDGDKQQQQPKAGDAQKDGDKQQQQPKAGDAQKDGDKQQQQPKAGDAQKDGDKQQQQPKAGDAQKDGDKQQQQPKAGDAQKDGDKQQQQRKAGDAQKDGDKQQQQPKAGDTQKDGDKQQQQPKAGDAQKDGDKQQQPKGGEQKADGAKNNKDETKGTERPIDKAQNPMKSQNAPRADAPLQKGDHAKDKNPGQAKADPMPTEKELQDLIKALESKSSEERQAAKNELENIQENSKDAAACKRAGDALKNAIKEDKGQEGKGKGTGKDDNAPGKAPGAAKADAGQKPGSKPAGDEEKVADPKAPEDKNTKDDRRGQNKGSDQAPEGAGKPGDKDGSQKAENKRNSQPAANSKPSGTGDGSQPGGSDPSASMPKDNRSAKPRDQAGSRDVPPDPPLEPDASHQKKAGNLQLEDLKKKVSPEILKKANMTEEEYRTFLRAYEELLKQRKAAGEDKENLAAPQLGGRGAANPTLRKVEAGALDKANPLQSGGPGLAPPEFRPAQKEFTRKLAELERQREKK